MDLNVRIHQLQATEQILQFALCGLHCVWFSFSHTPDWVRHRSGQRDHGHPGSGRQPGGHEKQTGAHGGGDQPIWTARHRRGPGVCYCVVFSFRECGNFKTWQSVSHLACRHCISECLQLKYWVGSSFLLLRESLFIYLNCHYHADRSVKVRCVIFPSVLHFWY